MINADRANPVTGVTGAPPSNEHGLDYGTLQAARGEGHPANPFPKTTDRNKAFISSHGGGSLSSVSFVPGGTYDQIFSRTRPSGGTRGKISGMSRSSRRNLLRRVARINRTALAASEARVLFVTLTYPGEGWPKDPGTCKAHLKAFLKRVQRKYGEFAAYWRMGIQERGAWHFHLILYVWPPFAAVGELRRFMSSAWYEVCGKITEGHISSGTRVEEVWRWRRETSYVERYLARKEEFPDSTLTGRVWGMWKEGLLPIRPEAIEVSPSDAYKVRRVYRKLAKRRATGTLNRTTVFVRHENVVRLLEFLGHRLE